MFGLGTGELVVILGVFALTFGAKRLPEFGRGLGQGMRLFKESLKGNDEPEHKNTQDAAKPAPEKKPIDPAA